MSEPLDPVEKDYETYKSLLAMWSNENPIKTNKLQVLLAVNAILVSAIQISGGICRDRWYVYLAGAVFCAIWTFSIGRTSLFQDIWQIKIKDLRDRYPNDPRFSVLNTGAEKTRVSPMLRAFGCVSSKWYLLFSPLIFAIIWLLVLAYAFGWFGSVPPGPIP